MPSSAWPGTGGRRWLALAPCALALALALCTVEHAKAQDGAAAADTSSPRALGSWSEARSLLDRHQPLLREQRAAVDRARADVTQVLGRLLPSLDLGLGVDYSLVRPSFVAVDRPAEHELFASRSLIPNASASFSITFSLARLAEHDAARAGVDAERQGLAQRRHELVASLASTLLGVLGAERVAERSQSALSAAQERMRLSERLVELGRTTTLDSFRFAQDLHEAQANVLGANEALAQARDALGGALGLQGAVGLAPEFDALALLSAERSGCEPIAELEARPERSAARARQRQAQAASRAAGLAYLPELQVVSQYVASYAPNSAVTFDGDRGVLHNWAASANLVWKVYDGGVRGANSARAEADSAAARAGLDAAKVASTSEARAALRLVAVAEAMADVARRDVASARELDALSQKALELGTASALEVVDAARRLRETEITLAVREVELIAARVRARMAMAVCR